LRHRFAKIEEIDDLSFEITAVTFSEACFHAAYSLIPWSNILAHLTLGPGAATPELRMAQEFGSQASRVFMNSRGALSRRGAF
jgi:hypothetical protein